MNLKFNQLAAELKINSIPVASLIDSLMLLGPVSLRIQYNKAIESALPALKSATTTNHFFFHFWHPLCSFIDYHLLAYLIREFGSNEINQGMRKYESDVWTFMKETTIEQLLDCLPGDRTAPANFDILKAKMGEDPYRLTLEELDHLRLRLCAELRLRDIVFHLIALSA